MAGDDNNLYREQRSFCSLEEVIIDNKNYDDNLKRYCVNNEKGRSDIESDLPFSLLKSQILVSPLKNLRAICAYSKGLATAGSCSASKTIHP